ncbi:hypothetical protein DERP_011675 [Dermatophagoides pteronyssinus]|uniref:Uncharacterized protein n=1 Tax=Dermatophagoides pteronyssinus TaxID=6956 RepID=A0ABQ8J325_DERPT|nr:hypothetical protein DERP_011675 [Dermatophagoides pteronyssinus]
MVAVVDHPLSNQSLSDHYHRYLVENLADFYPFYHYQIVVVVVCVEYYVMKILQLLDQKPPVNHPNKQKYIVVLQNDNYLYNIYSKNFFENIKFQAKMNL